MTTTYNFPAHYKGDTMEPVVFTITVNGSPLNLTDAEIKMDVRKNGTLKIRYTNEVDGGLSIIAPATDGKLSFDKKIVDISANLYNYDIEITLPNSDVKTYISGTWQIIQDITHE